VLQYRALSGLTVDDGEGVGARGPSIDAALTRIGETGAPASQTECNRMHTVLIYMGAADRKSEGDEMPVPGTISESTSVERRKQQRKRERTRRVPA
jgi:hypothetical protein